MPRRTRHSPASIRFIYDKMGCTRRQLLDSLRDKGEHLVDECGDYQDPPNIWMWKLRARDMEQEKLTHYMRFERPTENYGDWVDAESN